MTAPSDNELWLRPQQTSPIGQLGRALLDGVTSLRDVYRVLLLTLYYSVRGERSTRTVLRQMYEIGNRSLGFLCVVMGFIGMILVYQGGLQTERVVPDLSMLGATFLQLLVRDLAASICALMLATRVGAGIAAEIGSMVVTEQVDALRMCATDPIDYLIKPRFVASLATFGALVVIAALVAFLAGMWTAQAFFGINPRTFANTSMVHVGDLVIGLTKCVAYGAAIPVISGYCGLTAFGGSEGVGAATTNAVVSSSLAVIVLNFLISGTGYLVFG
jgi:phospholipid/cholesterol/gamma-HCH transport system permease protein